MRIEIATIDDIPLIQEIADRTWNESFKAVISQKQVDYMLARMYTYDVLSYQMAEGKQVFLLVHEEEQCAGFASYELNANETNITRLHKLFVLPELQKSGAGSILLDEVISIAREHRNESIHLSVNRQNPAVDFYLSRGFEILEEDDIEIGEGFVLKDYIMELKFV
jgi:ribosomal protein S18 acetylase RimI-like enzyme